MKAISAISTLTKYLKIQHRFKEWPSIFLPVEKPKNLDCAFWKKKKIPFKSSTKSDCILRLIILYEISDSDTWMKKLLPQKDMPIDTYISWNLSTSRSTLRIAASATKYNHQRTPNLCSHLVQVQKLLSGRKKVVSISDNEEED